MRQILQKNLRANTLKSEDAFLSATHLRGHSGQIRKAIDELLSAKRPVIYTGGGVVQGNASALLTELAPGPVNIWALVAPAENLRMNTENDDAF